MTLTILSVAYPMAPVGPDAVGGAEQVLSHLDRALTEAGHRSIVVAQTGSQIAGTLLPVPAAAGTLNDAARDLAHWRVRRVVGKALERFPVDLVHMHGIDFYDYLPPPGVPVLATLHLPPSWYPAAAFSPSRPGTWLNCVSESQLRGCPPGAPLIGAIPNGVPIDALQARHAKRRFVLNLGRICAEKGVHIAIDAARRAELPILLAGAVFRYEAHQRYFDEEVRPRLGKGARFIGPVGFARKRRLLSAARCLVLPTLAPETSSLVAMEALACGTPVVAFSSGALPEIIEHGRTGFLVHDEWEMAEALKAVGTLDPDACRAAAEERFSLDRMVARYLDLYRDLSSRRGPFASGGVDQLEPTLGAAGL